MSESAFRLLNPDEKQSKNGTICRVFKNKNYTTMSNLHLRDKNLSLKAKGLLSLVLSLPENWNYTISGLVSIVQEGEFAVKSILKELQEQKYLVIRKIMPNKETKVLSYEYRFFESPENCTQDLTTQGLGNQMLDNQMLDNQTQINKEQQLTEQIKIDNNNKKTIQKSSTKETEDEIFNRFWELFPRKRRGGKEESFRAWNKALKREDITPEQILEVVKVYANSDEVKRGYAKGCAAWLNGSCFLNEYQSIKENSDMNPVLEYFIKTYEPEEMLTNSVLRERYIRKHSSSADELLNACEGNVERAKEMINYYVSYIREKGKEFFLWDILNNFCRIHDALKYRKGGKTWEMK